MDDRKYFTIKRGISALRERGKSLAKELAQLEKTRDRINLTDWQESLIVEGLKEKYPDYGIYPPPSMPVELQDVTIDDMIRMSQAELSTLHLAFDLLETEMKKIRERALKEAEADVPKK